MELKVWQVKLLLWHVHVQHVLDKLNLVVVKVDLEVIVQHFYLKTLILV